MIGPQHLVVHDVEQMVKACEQSINEIGNRAVRWLQSRNQT